MNDYPELQEDLRGFIERDIKLVTEKGKEMEKGKLNYLIQSISTSRAILYALENGRINR